MKEQKGKLSRDEFLSFVKAVLKKKSLEENKPLYFEYRLSENGEKEKFLNRFDAFAPEGFSEYRNSVIFEFIYSRTLKQRFTRGYKRYKETSGLMEWKIGHIFHSIFT